MASVNRRMAPLPRPHIYEIKRAYSSYLLESINSRCLRRWGSLIGPRSSDATSASGKGMNFFPRT